MIKIQTRIKIPFLWGKAVFKKENWSHINLIVGPNGSGKTILADKIATEFYKKGYNITFLRSDRQNQENLYQVLKDNENIKNRVENVLSNMFGKSIRFIEDIDGKFIPIVKNKSLNLEYMLEEEECHGLKEIIILLICLYSARTKTKNCIFFDEPELHLHPQFQTFFMNEIRKESQSSPKNVFFLITHSPFFIDLKYSDDLIGVVVCHTNREPTYIESLNQNDDYLFVKFLPRFNTYHKQFFFSDNQIFVEGYTDQQLLTNLLNYVDSKLHTAGTGIIDVGGKDELGVFCKVFSLLGTNGRIITDLDSLFSGKLREVFNKDSRVNNWLLKQYEKQLDFYKTIFSKNEINQDIDLMKLIYKLEKYIIQIGQELTTTDKIIPKPLINYVNKVDALKEKHINADAVDTYKTVILQGIINEETELRKFLSTENVLLIPKIKNLFSFILAAAENANVYILSKGCIEHYYKHTTIQYMPISSKDKLFRNEIEYLQNSTKKSIYKDYKELLQILTKACGK